MPAVRPTSSILFLIVLLVAAPAAFAQKPAPTPSERIEGELAHPFCYFLLPGDEIGFKDCPEGTQVTFDGAFNTGFGEFDLFAGFPEAPVNQRVKTLEAGHLPIVQFEFERDGCRFRVEAFATPVDLDPRQNLIHFVRVTAENRTPIPLRARIGGAFVDRHGTSRENLGCPDWYRDRFMDHAAFLEGSYRTTPDGTGYRGDHVLFTSSARAPLSLVRETDAGARALYEADLKPRQQASVVFKFPYVPIDIAREEAFQEFLGAKRDEYLARTRSFWTDIVDAACSFEVAEEKAVNTWKASLIYDLIARDIQEDGKRFIQKVSDVHYDAFWVRDGAFIVRAYDLLGLHDIAEETIEHFLLHDEEGRVVRFRGHQPDSWGQSLWTVGAHYRITGDLDFARRIYPAIPPHIEVFETESGADPDGLWPVSGPYDNEAINGHYTGHNFWALLGLTEAIHLSQVTGHSDDARRFEAIRERYEARVMKALKRMTAQTDGYIPPGLDDPAAGFDWANASGGIYPFRVLAPHHPWAEATLRTVREFKYREGIMTYGPNAWVVKERERDGFLADPGKLHHYETMYVTEGLLRQGKQQEVIEDFYSILVHTGSTQAGFEWGIPPWDTRDPGGNLPPHGWFAARYIALLRNMLVHEDGDDLHLAAALSPAWLEPGKRVRIARAPTDFGPISYTLQATSGGADLRITPSFRNAPGRIVFHLPWFARGTKVTVEEKELPSTGGRVELPAGTTTARIEWDLTGAPDLSFDTGVRNFLVKHWDPKPWHDPGFLFPRASRPRVVARHRMFLDHVDVELLAPDGEGDVRFTRDGAAVTAKSPRYDKPIRVDRTTTIKALTVTADGTSSEPVEVRFEKTVPRKATAVRDLAAGVRYEYFEGAWSRLPDFEKLEAVRVGSCKSFDIQAARPRPDDFAVRFRGFLEVPEEGVYTFYTTSDDGSRLFIADRLVVDNDGLHPRQEEWGSIALAKGHHPITVTFFERGGVESISVTWTDGEAERAPIPEEHLFHGPPIGQ